MKKIYKLTHSTLNYYYFNYSMAVCRSDFNKIYNVDLKYPANLIISTKRMPRSHSLCLFKVDSITHGCYIRGKLFLLDESVYSVLNKDFRRFFFFKPKVLYIKYENSNN